MLVVENFINNEFVHVDKRIASVDPSVGTTWAEVPCSSKEHVESAVVAAERAFPSWSSTPAKERSRLMNKIADLLESRLDEFVEAESHDQGKPTALARMIDIPRAVYNFRFFAGAILYAEDQSTYLDEVNAITYVQSSACGVAGLISPWNLPLYLLTWKIAPCIGYGNTCVCKPSELTSVTAWMLCSVLKEAGLPPGVVNMVFGDGPSVGQPLVEHPRVPLISFTGSTRTGQLIQRSVAPHIKKLSLELGGKNAALVFADTNLNECVATTLRSCFANQGEVCLCTERVYVQDAIFKEFLSKFVEGARKLKVGDPRQSDTNLGAVISRDHQEKITSYIERAVSEGAQVQCGYGRDALVLPDELKNGFYVPPTVITGVTEDSAIMKEEVFGPIACVVPFSDMEDAVTKANGVDYGLCSTVWSSNVSTIHNVSRQLQVGTVWANCWMVRDLRLPFGGTNMSGLGREGMKGSREFFTEEKAICIKM